MTLTRSDRFTSQKIGPPSISPEAMRGGNEAALARCLDAMLTGQLKRMGYGRAGFLLLRQRVLHAL